MSEEKPKGSPPGRVSIPLRLSARYGKGRPDPAGDPQDKATAGARAQSPERATPERPELPVCTPRSSSRLPPSLPQCVLPTPLQGPTPVRFPHSPSQRTGCAAPTPS
ncbi:small ubiquitin-related modifier 3 isoform 1-T1 [Dugong dugon]